MSVVVVVVVAVAVVVVAVLGRRICIRCSSAFFRFRFDLSNTCAVKPSRLTKAGEHASKSSTNLMIMIEPRKVEPGKPLKNL